MTVKKKTLASAAVAAVSSVFAAALCAVLVSDNTTVDAEAYSYEFFEYTNCYAETNSRVPESTGIADARRGLAVRANASGAEVKFKTDVAGEFDFEFMPYSASAYGGSDYESSAYDNTYQDIRTMSLVFTDAFDASNTFTVRLTGGADGNNVTTNASVVIDGKAAGVYYYKDNAAHGSTSGNNENGVYTFLYGSGFSNVAVAAGAYSPKNVKPVRIVFDPSEMRVYGYNYGYNAYTPEKRLIWDLSERDNDGRDAWGKTLDGFEKYSVKLVFDDIKRDASGNIVVYSLNGRSLSNTLVQDVGPSCYCRRPTDAAIGDELTLPKPAVYDPTGGTTEFDGAVRLTKPDGTYAEIVVGGEKQTADKDGFCAYTVGAAAAITEKGEYKLEYKAKNAGGKYGEVYGVFFTAAREIRFELDGAARTYLDKGDRIDPPQGGWTVDGVKHAAAVKVTDPSGAILSAPYTVEKYGRYIVEYSATIGDRTLTSEYECYGLERNSQLFSVGGGMSVSSGVSALHTGLSGAIVESTVNNGVVAYSSPIKIKNKTKDDTLVSLMALPKKYGSAALGQIEIKLTDSGDPANYVSVIVAPGSDAATSVVRAASAEQSLSGLNGSGAIESFSGGGTTVLHSFVGAANYADIREQFIDFRLDYQTKRVYIGDKLVCDLDDSEHFVKTWNGFTSDDVILTVTMRDMSAERASVLINKADGKRIVGEHYSDCVSPTVIADFDISDVPTAIVGRKYPVLPVTVTDNEDPAPRYSVSVADERGNAVAIEDGAFVPTAAGKYAMTFAATDYTGNGITRTFYIEAVERVDELTVAPVGEVARQVKVGESVNIPSATTVGGCGLETVKIEAIGKTTGTKYAIGGAGTVKFLVADEYELVYTATDYLGNRAEYRAVVTATVDAAPVFDGEPVLPDVFIAGRRYTMGGLTAFDYKANAAATVDIFVSIDGGAPEKLGADGVYIPRIDGASATVTVIFSASSAGEQKNELRYDVSAINLYNERGELVIPRYFRTEHIDEITAGDDYTTFTLTRGDAKIGFVKDVYAHGFELMFDIPSTANNAESVVITLTDAADAAKKVVFEVMRGGFADQTSRVAVNGMQELTIEGNFFDAIKHLRLSYDNDSYAIKDASGLNVGFVKNYADGSQFRGFSDTVNFTIEFKGVSGIVNFNLYKLGNQLMMDNDGDYTGPMIVLDGEVARQVKKGGELVVRKAKAFDVLGFDTTLTVSVRNGKNDMLLAEAPCDREHTLALGEYGEYFVEYRATDDNYNVYTYALVVNVRDDVPPTIEADTTERVVYVSSEVSIAAAKITDDTELDATYVFVIDPHNNMINMTGASTFTPTERGVYTIRYVAVDKSGNIGIADAIVKATEA